jgi:hypothetical protein
LLHSRLVHCCCWDEASVAWQVAAATRGAIIQVPDSSSNTNVISKSNQQCTAKDTSVMMMAQHLVSFQG